MSFVCEVCGKGVTTGNTVARKGRPKYLGGVGVKTKGITRRKFKPNLRNVHVTAPNGESKTMCVCTKCIRSGRVVKRVHAAPFRLPKEAAMIAAKAAVAKGAANN